MKIRSTAPSGDHEGGCIDEAIDLGEHDPKSLVQLPVTELIRRATTRELTWSTGHCAGCNHEYRNGERHAACGLWTWPGRGIALYTLCWKCAPLTRNRKFRTRLRDDAYRSLFKAGPDDVGGSA